MVTGKLVKSRIAVLWSRIGPYHAARLRGAEAFLSFFGVEVLGIEVASRDHYQWDTVEGATTVHNSTLFQGSKYGDVGVTRIFSKTVGFLSRTSPDAVAVNGWRMPESLAAIAWCWSRSVPCVLMSETKSDDAVRRQPFRELMKAAVIRRCGAALVGGRRQAEYLVQLGFPESRIQLGYDVVDNDYFTSGSSAARSRANELRREYSLPERYFFACTRFLPRKNMDGLLRAYRQYRRGFDGQPWGLVISGSGDEGARLLELARDLQLEGVHWPGFVQYDQLPTYYGLASAFVHPAHQEAWGLVVNEAAASGLPLIVGSTVGAACELVRDGDNGYLVDSRSDEDLCRAMLAVSRASEEERLRMGARSREIVAEWSPRRFGEGLLAAARAAGADLGSAGPGSREVG